MQRSPTEHSMNRLGRWRRLLVGSRVHHLVVIAELGEHAGEPACPAAGLYHWSVFK